MCFEFEQYQRQHSPIGRRSSARKSFCRIAFDGRAITSTGPYPHYGSDDGGTDGRHTECTIANGASSTGTNGTTCMSNLGRKLYLAEINETNQTRETDFGTGNQIVTTGWPRSSSGSMEHSKSCDERNDYRDNTDHECHSIIINISIYQYSVTGRK